MSPTAHLSHFHVNAHHWAGVEEDLQSIIAHLVVARVKLEMPLTVDKSDIAPSATADPTPSGRRPSF
jgi:hypothetical protein